MEKEFKERRDMLNFMVDMMAGVTKNKKILAFQAYNNATNKMQELVETFLDGKPLKEEQLDKFISLFNQFEQLTEDLIKTI